MNIELIVTFVGIVVAGLAGVLGVWMERDPGAPPRWAYVFSGLICTAMLIEGGHAVAQATDNAATEEATAEVLEKLAELAETSDDPALQQFVGAELAAQARSNPRMMKRLEKRVAAKGGDPQALRRKAVEGRRKAAGLPSQGARQGGQRGTAPRDAQQQRTRSKADAPAPTPAVDKPAVDEPVVDKPVVDKPAGGTKGQKAKNR